jgi:hypothetical protein
MLQGVPLAQDSGRFYANKSKTFSNFLLVKEVITVPEQRLASF